MIKIQIYILTFFLAIVTNGQGFLPVAYYPFEGNANDMSGNGNHAIVYGSSPTQNLQGDSSTAYSFDGIDDNINIGVKPSIQITGNLTISVWIKIEDYNGNIQSIINCQADNTDNIETNALYSIYFSNNNKYLTYTHESGNGINQSHDFNRFFFDIKKWYHIVIIRNVEQKTVSLFVNGHQVDGISYTDNTDNGKLSGLRIGRSNGTIQNSSFYGAIDDIYIFDKLLNYDQIIELYELTAKIKKPTNLLLNRIENTSIELQWEDNSKNEDGYEIERKSFGQSFQLISLVDINQQSFIDTTLYENTEYCYRVRAFKDVEFANHSDYSNEVCKIISGVNEVSAELTSNFNLFQNYPNPFNPTTISYQIPNQVRDDNANLTLKVYDVLGREIKTLVNEVKSSGNYEVTFEAANLPSGVYYYRLKSNDFVQTKKMLFLK